MIRTIISDDEALSRKGLWRILAALPDIALVAECADGAETIAQVNALKPDLLFLDINFPDANGLDLIRHFSHQPHIVFATAYDEFAVRAFEERATDYVLKPFRKSRVTESVERVRARRKTPGASEAPAPSLVVREGSREVLLRAEDILVALAEGNYVKLATTRGTFFVRGTISSIEQALRNPLMIRTHRSALVHSAQIAGFQRAGVRRVIVLKDGTTVPLSQERLPALREQLPGMRRLEQKRDVSPAAI